MSLNLMDKQVRAEWEALAILDAVYVEVNCKKLGECLYPSEDGDEVMKAAFRTMTFNDYSQIDCDAMVETEIELGTIMTTDFELFEVLLLNRMLIGCNCVELEHDEETGWLTDESYKRFAELPAPLVEAFLNRYEMSINLTDEEELVMDRQAAILFAKNSRGVSNACEAVSKYCTFAGFWDKFGLNRFDLEKLSYREFMMLKFILGKDNESHAAAMRESSRPVSGTRVAGAGGRTRPSRAIVVGRG